MFDWMYVFVLHDIKIEKKLENVNKMFKICLN